MFFLLLCSAEVTLYLSCPCHLVTAVAATGIVWSRYSTVITPKNWNLFSVNVAMAGTGLYQLSRKLQHDYFSEEQVVVAKE
ncbi:hypothetical protein RHGRI_037155 [Rhododendron griersonianum]|uniref:Mitochondrial pyruvate carrier n=1 Tax=Rhododendron griersonianum TaxID=479676 RepID=A0AAV6HRR8_9ERIC|nr:hypothetical protein RHGRI_037155 [Rhododendron griersonianum]